MFDFRQFISDLVSFICPSSFVFPVAIHDGDKHDVCRLLLQMESPAHRFIQRNAFVCILSSLEGLDEITGIW